MQQTCVDDVLTRNYTELDDTESLNDVTGGAVGEVVRYKCEPFNCNGNGRCVNGTCVCNPGTSYGTQTTIVGAARCPILGVSSKYVYDHCTLP